MEQALDFSKPVQTFGGKKAYILSCNGPDSEYPCVGYLEGERTIRMWAKTGYNRACSLIQAKEKKMVPLEAADIKPTDMFRPLNSTIVFYTISWLSKKEIALGNVRYSFYELQNGFEISRDGGATWTKCEKEVEV